MLFLEAQLSDKIDTILKRTSTVTKDTFCSSASTSFQLTNQAIDTSGKTSKLKNSKGRHLILFVGGVAAYLPCRKILSWQKLKMWKTGPRFR